MSYQNFDGISGLGLSNYPSSSQNLSASRLRRVLAVVIALVMVAGGGLVYAVVSPSGVSAQTRQEPPLELNPQDCRNRGSDAWIPTPESREGEAAVAQLRVECEILVRARNAWLSHPDTVLRDTIDDTGAWEDGIRRHVVFGGWGAEGLRFNQWTGITFETERQGVDGHGPITSQNVVGLTIGGRNAVGGVGLGGTLPAELCELSRLEVLRIDYNYFSGSIPECFGDQLPNLAAFSARVNNFTGSIPAGFGALPNLELFDLFRNKLTGSLPGGWNNLVYINLAANFISGEIPEGFGGDRLGWFNAPNMSLSGELPSSWTNPGGFEGVIHISLQNNDLEGVLNIDWLNRVEFLNVPQLKGIQLHGNRFCFDPSKQLTHRPSRNPLPSEIFTFDKTPEQLRQGIVTEGIIRASNRSLVDFTLGSQTCNDPNYSNSALYALAPITDYTKTLSGDGNSMELSWNLPIDPATGQPYAVKGYAIAAQSIWSVRLYDQNGNPRTPGGDFTSAVPNVAPPSAIGLAIFGDIFSSGLEERELTREGILWADAAPDATSLSLPLRSTCTLVGTDARIDEGGAGLSQCGAEPLALGEYVVNIIPYYNTIEDGFLNSFRSQLNGTALRGWRARNVIADGTSVSDIGVRLGLIDESVDIFSWDAPSQRWQAHTIADSTVLSEGTAVMYIQGWSRSDNLASAGLSRADENIDMTLYRGWNIFSAGAAELDSSDFVNASVLFDDSLFDCDILAGVLATVVYDFELEEFKLALPCFPDIPTPAGYASLDAIDRHDTVFVFFQSELPVPVTWDSATNSYVAA